MTTGLPVSRIVNVTVDLTPIGAQTLNFDTLVVLGDSNVINGKDRIRSYGSQPEVESDFGTEAPEALAADLFFSQKPQPAQLYIGRWLKTATAALLICGPLTPTQQLISNWMSITEGSFKIAEDGGAVTNVSALNFSGASNLNGVATIINTALAAATLTATVAWNGAQFVFTSGTTGANSAVAYLTAGTENDISAQLMGTVSLAEETVPGYVAESALGCVEAIDQLSTYCYGITFAAGANNADIADSDHLAIAAYVEASPVSGGNPHVYGLTTSEAAALSTSDSTSIGYQLREFGYERTFYQWSSGSPFAVSSFFGRAFTVDFNAEDSTITMMFKQEPGVVAETLTSTQANALNANNYNYYALFNNNTNIIVNGVVASGEFFDTIWGLDWQANRLQTDAYNLLLTNPKIPQTDAGVHLLVTGANSSLAAGVDNGLLAPGQWNAAGFGTLSEGNNLTSGYYVYAPPVATQSEATRAERECPPIQCAAKLAGAIQSVSFILNVNQ